MPTSQDHSPGRAKLFRDELLRKRHATQNNALSRQRPAATVLSEGKFAAMFVTDLGAVPMRPRGAGGIVCADTRAPISGLAGSDLPRAGGGPPMFEFTRPNKPVAENRARQAAQRLAAPAKKAVRSYGSADCPCVRSVSRTWRNLALTAISICATGASLVVTSMVANAQSCNNPGTTNVFTGGSAIASSAVNQWGPSA